MKKTTKITMNNNAAAVETRTGSERTASRRLADEPTLPKRNQGRGARGIADLFLQTDAFPPCRGGDIIRFLSLAGRVSRRRPQGAAALGHQGRAPWHEKIRVRR